MFVCFLLPVFTHVALCKVVLVVKAYTTQNVLNRKKGQCQLSVYIRNIHHQIWKLAQKCKADKW